MSPPSTKPGSIAHRIAATVLAHNQAGGQGLSVTGARNALFPAPLDAPKAFTSMFHSLVRRGVLVAVGGPPGDTQYAHHTVAADVQRRTPPNAADADLAAVERALYEASREKQRPVTTREVAAVLKAQNIRLESSDLNAVRVRLQRLARARRRGHSAWRAPRAEWCRVQDSSGRAMLHWAPAGSPFLEPPATPASAAAAVRTAVGLVSGALQRAVTRLDLVAWMKAHPQHPATQALAGYSLATVLDSTARFDRDRAHAEALRKLDPITDECGTAPKRYYVGAGVGHMVATERLEHVAVGLRVADEMDSIMALGERAVRGRLPALIALAKERWQLLHSTVWRVVGDDPAVLMSVALALYVSYDVERQWLQTRRDPVDTSWHRRVLSERERHVRAAFALLAGKSWGNHPFLRRGTCWVRESTFAPWTEALARAYPDNPEAVRRAAFRGVRRQRVQRAPIIGRRITAPHIEFDRVDGLLRMYEMAGAPRAQAYLVRAHNLLGPLVRDPKLVRPVLEELRDTPGPDRDGATIALALLGVDWPDQTARPEDGDPFADEVRVLRAILATGNVSQHVIRTVGVELSTKVVRRLRSDRILHAIE